MALREARVGSSRKAWLGMGRALYTLLTLRCAQVHVRSRCGLEVPGDDSLGNTISMAQLVQASYWMSVGCLDARRRLGCMRRKRPRQHSSFSKGKSHARRQDSLATARPPPHSPQLQLVRCRNQGIYFMSHNCLLRPFPAQCAPPPSMSCHTGA